MKKSERYFVKIKKQKGIAEYLHGLIGPVVKVKKESIIKRVPPHNNPKKVGIQTLIWVDLSAHHCYEIDDSISKVFWFTSDMITRLEKKSVIVKVNMT